MEKVKKGERKKIKERKEQYDGGKMNGLKSRMVGQEKRGIREDMKES